MTEVRFTAEQLNAFGRLSHDVNPLHWDEAYSRKTQFGRVVVYGMCAVLFGLGEWARGRRFKLRTLNARFQKPLFLEEDYTLTISESGQCVSIRFLRSEVLAAKITFEWGEYADRGDDAGFTGPRSSWQARSEPRDWTDDVPPNGIEDADATYVVDGAYLPDLKESFSISPGQLPLHQVTALCWASYFVGMVFPGRRALFAGVRCRFDENAKFDGRFAVSNLSMEFDPGMNVAAAAGSGTGLTSFEIHALRRPAPISYSLEVVRTAVGSSKDFAGKIVFISGSSRGFGSVLAKAFALHGASLILSSRSSKQELADTERELESVGAEFVHIQGDLSNKRDCLVLADTIARKYPAGIDIIVNNASPLIRAEAFLEQEIDDFAGFVDRSIRMYARVAQLLIPLLRKRGRVINVSSSYTRQPIAAMSHYVSAKCAIEGLTRVLAEEVQDLDFIIVRPPRMLTDQTNGVLQERPSCTPVTVARSLLSRLKSLPSGLNFHELDL